MGMSRDLVRGEACRSLISILGETPCTFYASYEGGLEHTHKHIYKTVLIQCIDLLDRLDGTNMPNVDSELCQIKSSTV